jgi:hypothetical protein
MSIRGLALCIASGLLVAGCNTADDLVRPPRPPSDSTSQQQPQPTRVLGLPIGWSGSAGIPPLYTLGTERGNAHGGAVAAFITRTATSPTRTLSRVGTMVSAESSFAVLSQFFRADAYRGQRVRWSGWLHATVTSGEGAALWMRIDGPGVNLGFDNMSPRMVTAASGWEQFSVVLDVPARAIGIALGVYMVGVGEVRADDFALETVGDSVAVTNLRSGFEPDGTDSATVAGWYANAQGAPRNLRFEGLGEETAGAASWLLSVAVPLATVQPGADVTDLAPLRAMVGSARLLGMGEGTHGTREFFLLKHRVLQYLVSEMGFTHFAIEAT